jgi:hypothetical protein
LLKKCVWLLSWNISFVLDPAVHEIRIIISDHSTLTFIAKTEAQRNKFASFELKFYFISTTISPRADFHNVVVLPIKHGENSNVNYIIENTVLNIHICTLITAHSLTDWYLNIVSLIIMPWAILHFVIEKNIQEMKLSCHAILQNGPTRRQRSRIS